MSWRSSRRRTRSRLASQLVLLGALLAAIEGSGHADTYSAAPADGAAPPAPVIDPALAESQAPRPLPDYGRPSGEPFWQQAALAVPRMALAPLYVTAHLVAQPLVVLGILAEKHHLRERIHDYFTFGPEQRLALYPIVWIELGFRPVAGGQFSWNPRGRANDLRLRVTTGGSNWWNASCALLLPLQNHQLSLQTNFIRRDDAVYHGFGRESRRRAARYGEQRWESRAELGVPLGGGLALSSSLLHEWWRSDLDPSSQAYSLADAVEAGQLSPPPSVPGGVHSFGNGLRLVYDNRRGRLTRRPRDVAALAHVSGTGVAARVQLIQHTGLQRIRANAGEPRLPAWLSFAAGATGTLDVTGTQRRVELELYLASADPLPGASDVPFTEQVSLGGARHLPGFGSRRLVGRSAAAAALRYRWPIWSELDGNIEYAVGNVFGPHWRGFELQDARASFALGIVSAAASDHVFELLLAVGSEPFAAGGKLESTRLAVGWNAEL